MRSVENPRSGSQAGETWSKIKEDRHGDLIVETFTRRRNEKSLFLAKIMLHAKGRLKITMVAVGENLSEIEDAIREHYIVYRMGRLKTRPR